MKSTPSYIVHLGAFLFLVVSSARPDSLQITVSGNAQTLSPSSDSLILFPNSVSEPLGTLFTLQTGTFAVGNSGSLMGAYPVNVVQSVSLGGQSLPLSFSGTIYVTNPTSLNEDTLTLGGAAVFFPSSGVFLVPNLYASPGGGVGASFPVQIQAMLSSPNGTGPQKQDQQSYKYAGAAISAMAVGIGACAIATPCLALLLSAGATTGDIAIITATTGTGGIGLSLLGGDPVDFNYKVVATPGTPVVPILSSSASPVLHGIVSSEATTAVLVTAMITSFERAEGAYYANNPYWEQLQLNAFSEYESELRASLLQTGADFNDLAAVLGNQYPNVIGNNANELISVADHFGQTTVPEPAGFSLSFAGGLALFLGLRLRRSHQPHGA